MLRLFRRPLLHDLEKSPTVEQLIEDIEKKYTDDDYIHGRFLTAVQHYTDMARQNSDSYAVFRTILIGVSALTPFTVGLEAIVLPSNILKLIALLLALIVALLGNYLTAFNVQAKWGAYRSVRESLIAEFYKFHMGVEPYSTADERTKDRRLFAANVERLIKEANEAWGGLQQAGSQQG